MNDYSTKIHVGVNCFIYGKVRSLNTYLLYGLSTGQTLYR